MKQLKKQIQVKEKTTSNPEQEDLLFNGFHRVKNFVKKVIIVILFFFSSMVIGSFSEPSVNAMDDNENSENTTYISSIKSRVNEQLVNEVRNYLSTAAPGTRIDPTLLVALCDQYEMDISFVLAQGLLESHMGTKGKAAQTNSVWNVGTFDDGTIKYRYSHPNESIEPYLKLVTQKYLIRITSAGDTLRRDIIQLTRDRGFINYRGLRYASEPNYESLLRRYILEISMNTKIPTYQGIIYLADHEILNFFSPVKDSLLLANL